MNAHQRRKAKRLYERAFGNHVDYYFTVEVPIRKVDKKHPTTCEHCGDAPLKKHWDDDRLCYVCYSCGGAVAVQCPLCGGDGDISEADYENDWVNFTDDEIITCPECGGYGWTADPSFQ